MKPGALGGPLLAFASLAIMLVVIAGLVAFLISDGRIPSDDDTILGENGRIGPVPTITTRALADSYPFSTFLELLPGTSEAVFASQQSGQQRLGDPWFGQFVLEKPTPETLADLQRQVEANGLQTTEIQGREVGFSFRSPEFQGVVQLYEFAANHHLLGVVVVRYQQRAQ